MKNKLIRIIINITKYTAIAFSLLIITMSTIMAEKGKAQVKSVKEVMITLKLKDSSLKSVFSSIEEQTDFNFIYSKQNVGSKKDKINLDLKEATVEQVLIEVSKQTGLKFRQVNERISAVKIDDSALPDEELVKVLADININGKVVDENSQPLPGVSVIIKGTSNGVVTDLDGNYKITLAEDVTTLVYSFVGYEKQEVEIAGRSEVNVNMEIDISQLDEVVIVGYGTQQKAKVTGSVASIKKDILIDRSANSFSSSGFSRCRSWYPCDCV